MSNLDYVRTEMIPEQDAPVSQIGLVRWVRENLFSGWLNTVLTLLSLLAVYWIFQHIWPWFAHSVWNADSLDHCREIIKAKFGE